jgi:2-hydroxychromene-2-carboxylate isomerase
MTSVRACWERNLNVASDDVLSSIITDAGYDAKDILSRANSPQIKSDLRTRTKEAKDVGICGVPSYRVYRRKEGQGDTEWKLFGDIVWGQDESAVVEDLIAGWDGEEIADLGMKVKTGGTSRL